MSTCHELSVTWNVFLLKIFSGDEAFEAEMAKMTKVGPDDIVSSGES